MARKYGAAALRFILPVLSLAFLFGVGYSRSVNAKDDLPSVRITAPKNNSTYKWNTRVNYSVVVSFQGKSTQYKELPSNQVLLTTTYVPDLSAVAGRPEPAAGGTPAGLLDIIRSDCLGCHEFNAKAMGPSFAAIAGRYSQNPAMISALSGHILNGSTGIWGPDSMPPHPELTDDQAHAIALWITKDAANPNVSYQVGTEGAILMKAIGTPDSKAGVLLKASYTSPSPSANAEQAPYGEDTVILHGN